MGERESNMCAGLDETCSQALSVHVIESSGQGAEAGTRRPSAMCLAQAARRPGEDVTAAS